MRNKWFEKIVAFAPLICLLVAVGFNMFNIFFPDKTYDEVYFIVSGVLAEYFGFSLATILVYAFMAYKHRFCLYTKIAIGGLLFQHLTNVIDTLFGLSYVAYYEISVLFVLSIFLIFSLISIKWKLK